MRNTTTPATTRRRGFTLIEVMIVIALVAIVVSLAGPSFREYILMQRLRSVQSQLVTDLNYARSEAVSRGVPVQLRMQTASDQTCYIIYSRPSADLSTTNPCDCTAAAGSRCPASSSEIKTASAPTSEGVAFWQAASQTAYMTINPRTGAPDTVGAAEMATSADYAIEARLVDASRRFKVSVSPAGRVQVCSPSGTVAGMPVC